jgi:hypothetical protein
LNETCKVKKVAHLQDAPNIALARRGANRNSALASAEYCTDAGVPGGLGSLAMAFVMQPWHLVACIVVDDAIRQQQLPFDYQFTKSAVVPRSSSTTQRGLFYGTLYFVRNSHSRAPFTRGSQFRAPGKKSTPVNGARESFSRFVTLGRPSVMPKKSRPPLSTRAIST